MGDAQRGNGDYETVPSPRGKGDYGTARKITAPHCGVQHENKRRFLADRGDCQTHRGREGLW